MFTQTKIEELEFVVGHMKRLGIKVLTVEGFHVELAAVTVMKPVSVAKGSTTNNIDRQALERELFEKPVYEGLTDDQLLGLTEIPADHPAYKLIHEGI